MNDASYSAACLSKQPVSWSGVAEDLPDEMPTQEPRRYQVVADRIRELVRSDKLQSGARLPSERELATRLCVGRALLREALIVLEIGGEIEVHDRSGVYVRELESPEAGVPKTGPGPFEVLSALRLIEPELAAIAAHVANDGAIDALLAARTANERGDTDISDRSFHQALVRATGNSALVGMMEYLWDQSDSLLQTLKQKSETEEVREEMLVEQRRIVEAIAARKPNAARQAMRAHLERLARTLTRR